MLVPEISLTPQMVQDFEDIWEKMLLFCSRLSAGERYDEWKRILRCKHVW